MKTFLIFVFGLIVGGSVMTFLMYFYLIEKADIKKQKNSIIRFITAMKRVAKTGDTQRVKKSVRKFTLTCCNFYAQSFTLTKFPVLEEVGAILEKEVNKKGMYTKRQFDLDGIDTFPEIPSFEFVPKTELQKTIEEKLLETIGVN